MSYDTQVPPAAPRVMRNGLGTAALILGIIGTLSGFMPFLFWLAGILGVIALILGLVGKGRVKRGEANNKGVALTGALLGLASLILSVVGMVIVFTAVSDAVDEIDKSIKDSAPKDPTSKAPAGDTGKADKKGQGLEDGDSSVYDDDLTVTVSDPKPYSPDEYAAGHTKGNKAYQVTVVIENKGKEKFDTALVSLSATAGKNGVTAEEIFDNKVGSGFEGTIMPGKKATITAAFDAPEDAKNLTVEVNPGFTYDASQWELKIG
ncbi:DUF4190 domain-containing protein [Streptomyces globisporus]|uniref:DUF4190 domain-containing protein n=1 Tax=Streptomyces globisporus TaxID=1908 RepID=UPI0004C61F1D|nr:DUF4190 domain-containing protein [Streptomyces globisporus]